MATFWRIFLCAVLFCNLGKGIEGSSGDSEEKYEVNTILTLSNHELSTLTKAFFEATEKPCPNINRKEMASIKNFVSGRVFEESLPMQVSENSEFNENYGKLVGCIENKNLKPTKPKGKKIQPEDLTNSELAGEEIHKNSRNKRQTGDHDLTENLLSKDFGSSLDYEGELSKDDIKKSFGSFFTAMSSIALKACPIGKRPTSTFIQNAINEILYYISTDPDMIKIAQLKYFRTNDIMGSLLQCEDKLEKKRNQISTTRSFSA